MPEINDMISALALDQLRYWLQRRGSSKVFMDDFIKMRRHRPDAMFLFEFKNNNVYLLEVDQTGPGREYDYLQLLKLVVSLYRLNLEGTIAVWVGDHYLDHESVPFFAFAKHRGRNPILLPDVDFLGTNFYSVPEWRRTATDVVPYSSKINMAAFVGSTSGDLHTLASVNAMGSKRLRSGVYFQSFQEYVNFQLPNIVQCDSEETEIAIRRLGFGVGGSDWNAQFRYKFLLSMDGNGATCSRVVIALKSNSVLIKHESDPFYDLYYFPAMVPGIHYVSVAVDSEVIEVIKTERDYPGTYAAVAANGQQFYRDFLTMPAVLRYTAELLSRYFRLFGDRVSCHPEDAYAAALPEVLHIFAISHISMRGDVTDHLYQAEDGFWVGERQQDSGRWLEGFELICMSGLKQNDIEYTASSNLDEPQIWLTNGEFVGSRGYQIPLRRFAIRLARNAKYQYQCRYYGVFTNGEVSDPCEHGAPCQSRDGAPLQAINVQFFGRAN